MRLPLIEGNYNITLVISKPSGVNSAVFCDFIENVYLFSMLPRNPLKLWDMVYLDNEYSVQMLESVRKRN